MKYIIILMISLSVFSQQKDIFSSVSYGEIEKGADRIDLTTDDFSFFFDTNSTLKMRAGLVKSSIEWIRLGGILLVPRARIKIQIEAPAQELHINYEKQNILFHQNNNIAEVEFYVSLFQIDDIRIIQNNKTIASVYVLSKLDEHRSKKHVIDYSCSRYNIEITGLDNEFVSLGCKENIYGKFGHEKIQLEVIWTASDYTLTNQATGPYTINFFDNNPVELNVVNRNGQMKKVTFQAKIPPRYKRIKTALGFGPYAYYAAEDDKILEGEVLPAFMAYGKFDLNSENSIRAFDALIFKDSNSYFNNPGMYYANDVALVMDKRVVITTLLGFQTMQFKFNKDTKAVNQFIFPQGLEVIWKHAFGIENYIVSYGMFLSPTDSLKYNNIWVRWGKKYFWEINYIDWGQDDKFAKTWGLSIGIPFIQLF